MIFRTPDSDKYLGEIVNCGAYHPYRIRNEEGERVLNPAFDSNSRLILDLKDNKAPAIEFYRQHLEKFVAEDVALVIVPSHDPLKTESGLRNVAHHLAGNNRIDATSCLVRTMFVPKLATGGDRDVSVHLGSIDVRNQELIVGREVLLLDDVTTSGNSLNACHQLLLKAGAKSVQRFALAQTAGN